MNYGTFKVGYMYENISFSTKAYTTQIKIYYPAASANQNATIDMSQAPYPTILWLPGTCCGTEQYADILMGMVSWGLVVITLGLDQDDYQHSGNVTDLNELMDYLETMNANWTERLHSMIDVQAFGLSGHSSGGGLALIDAINLPRIKASEVLSPAITNSTVDSIKGLWKIPFFCQAGFDDWAYINGCRRAYDDFNVVKGKAEIIGGGHTGPFDLQLMVDFYLYFLDGRADLYSSLYDEQALEDMLVSDYDLAFKTSETHFFPPILSISNNLYPYPLDNNQTYPMDCVIEIHGELVGYFLPRNPQSLYTWDYDGDGVIDKVIKFDDDSSDFWLEHTYPEIGNYSSVFRFKFGHINVKSDDNDPFFKVVNVPPRGFIRYSSDGYEDDLVSIWALDVHDAMSDMDTVKLAWDFGDGAHLDYTPYNDSRNVTHVYTESGDYTIGLLMMDKHGAVGEAFNHIHVKNRSPTAFVFKDIFGFKDQPLSFSGYGNDTPTDKSQLRYRWDFGDGDMSSWSYGPDAQHAYRKAGKFVAVFSVQDPHGQIANASLTVTINNTAPWGYISSPVGDSEYYEWDTIRFECKVDDTVTDMELGFFYRWDLGDGTITEWSASNSTERAYSADGIYKVTVQFKDYDGAVGTDTLNVQVMNKRPIAIIREPITNVTVIEDEGIIFRAEGIDTPSDVDKLTLSWEIDGKVYDGGSVFHTFTKSGTYLVQFQVTDPDGAKDMDSIVVTVDNVQPTVTPIINPQSVELGNGIGYTAIINDTPTDLTNIHIFWDFGDGNTSTSKIGVHIYSMEGTYTIKVKVIDDDGLYDATTFDVLVTKPYSPPPSTPATGGGRDAAGLIGLLVLIVLAGIVLMATAFMERRADNDEPRARPTNKKKRHTKHNGHKKYPD